MTLSYSPSRTPKNKMSSSVDSIVPSARGFSRRLLRKLSPLLMLGALSAPLLAQDTATPPAAPDANAAPMSKADRRAQRGNFSPEAMMAQLKDRFGVTDDAEWALISARLTTVIRPCVAPSAADLAATVPVASRAAARPPPIPNRMPSVMR